MTRQNRTAAVAPFVYSCIRVLRMERPKRTSGFSFEAVTSRDWVALRAASLRFARLWCRRPEDTEDVAHEALLALIRGGDAVHKPLDWLFIAIRRIAGRANVIASKSVVISDDGMTVANPNIQPTNLENSQDALKRFLYDKTISAHDRRILVLSLVGYSQREVARHVGQSQSAVSRSLTRLGRRAEQPSTTSPTHHAHH